MQTAFTLNISKNIKYIHTILIYLDRETTGKYLCITAQLTIIWIDEFLYTVFESFL